MTSHTPLAQGNAPRRASLSQDVCHWLGQCKVVRVFKHWQSQWHTPYAGAVLPLPLGDNMIQLQSGNSEDGSSRASLWAEGPACNSQGHRPWILRSRTQQFKSPSGAPSERPVGAWIARRSSVLPGAAPLAITGRRFAAAMAFPALSHDHAAHGARRGFSTRRRSRGFTLIEILVSLTITMMMMGAVVTLFGVMTDSVSGSRAVIEMSERLRACRNRLQADLQGATATMRPPLLPENDEGYFELIEGQDRDLNYATAVTGTTADAIQNSIFGDADDVLMFTVRSRGEPFVGKFGGAGTIESQVAEVIYFAQRNGPTVVLPAGNTPQQLYTLYRRVLLVAPVVGNIPQLQLPAFYDNNDISVRFQNVSVGPPPTFIGVPNTLGDLTKRENRFAHFGLALTATFTATFPFNVNTVDSTGAPAVTGWPAGLPTAPANNPAALSPLGNIPNRTRLGDDVLMTNVLAFDVQVYDPNAPIKLSATNPTALVFSDVAFNAASSTLQTGGINGAYVDLGNGSPIGPPAPFFNASRSQSVTVNTNTLLAPVLPLAPAGAFTYDTWSLHYENDGLPQPSTATTFDLGTNGLDDVIPPAITANGIVDDATEFDTQPPFAAPLRGIRVVIRAYEPGSQQVREVTVVQDFLPE